MNELMQAVTENLIFVAEFLGIVAVMFAVAYIFEKRAMKKKEEKERIFSTRKVAMIGMFSAIAVILMLLEIPVFFAPGFYKLDLSEIPALIGAFAFGPIAGVTIEFCKILLELLLRGTTTAFVGELANFIIGCSFLLPASIIYMSKKSKKMALIGSVTGTLCMTVFGTAFNAIYLLPKFAQLYGMPLDTIVGMGTAINPAINSVTTLVIFAVAPLNILKGGVVSSVTVLVYKKLSPILKEGHKKRDIRKAVSTEN
ncbi:ECF transporter S component [Kineothrix sp. MB12-C1]|uniref:ECF transporter S component n=1 Tax=Kineothrix sp. MB12-C1 TaxID=3070215 RepID=UPI0027D23C42|nr:ECF transporter S component [Kineothrix sp. MB12-C1]WMC93708.1 ECF transporter S component [Kineothrix sp. MB12-C1]